MGHLSMRHCNVNFHPRDSGAISVSGYPYAANGDYSGSMTYQGITKAGGFTQFVPVTGAGATGFVFEACGSGVALTAMSRADFPSRRHRRDPGDYHISDG